VCICVCEFVCVFPKNVVGCVGIVVAGDCAARRFAIRLSSRDACVYVCVCVSNEVAWAGVIRNTTLMRRCVCVCE